MTAAGALSGTAFAGAGAGVSALWSNATLPLAIGLGAIAFVYALHELGYLRVPVPGRDWQVPVGWVRGGFYRSAAIWGLIVGAGVFTRVTFAVVPILLAWLFVSGNVLYGTMAGALYGATRALSIYASAGSSDSAQAVRLNERLRQLAPAFHQAAGLALATFAAYLIVAPNLP